MVPPAPAAAELPVPTGLIPSLELLGCEASRLTGDDGDPSFSQLYRDAPLLTFYEVRSRSRRGRRKAKLGVYTHPEGRLQSTRLYVYSIRTTTTTEDLITAYNTTTTATSMRRRRGEGRDRARVKGHQLLMAFWTHTLRRDPGMLRRLYFDTVLEGQTTEILRRQVCPRLGQPCTEGAYAAPWETLNVYRPYSGGMTTTTSCCYPATGEDDNDDDATEEERLLWGCLVGEVGPGSRLVKVALHMCAAYPREDEYTGVLQVERVVFRPKMTAGRRVLRRPVGYDLEVRMGLEDSLAHRVANFATSTYLGPDESLASTMLVLVVRARRLVVGWDGAIMGGCLTAQGGTHCLS